ncbi:SHOCT domain-containing protein [Arthrobacter sulfonylureivorans]|uniref:SHOCT domain-containing protein n=1 Tax=Arthrobacter sulfonylureivorans TaxID=2486855 RepID=A0ABY3W7C5_9MICC|nr:SHOCT domain-containing protein [Arthrobacter sulfonylureivorans]UNK44237.1 SHOCT domain-containing protein [Arthrobacter sulfonylureivorans]
MMGFYGSPGMGWMWIFWILLIVGLVLLIILLVRLVGGGVSGRGTRATGGSRAREILAERYARGDLTAEEYREGLRTLDEAGE